MAGKEGKDPAPPLDRGRLAKILDLLDADFNADVAAAGRAADKLRREAGLSWREVLDGALPPSGPAEADLAICAAGLERLTIWQRGFVAALLLQAPMPIGPRQATILSRIAARCRAS